MDEPEKEIEELTLENFLLPTTDRKPTYAKHKYLTFAKALERLKIEKHDFVTQIDQGIFTPCFSCCLTLLAYGENQKGVEALGYIRFRGYITPTSDFSLINALNNIDKNEPFTLTHVKVVEYSREEKAFLINSVHMLDDDEPEYFGFPYSFSLQLRYEVDTTDLHATKEFRPADCVFIEEELENRLKLLSTQSPLNEKSNFIAISNKELIGEGFQRAILETLQELGYDPEALPYKKNSSKGGIRDEITSAIISNPKYKLLVDKTKNDKSAIHASWSKLKQKKLLKDNKV